MSALTDQVSDDPVLLALLNPTQFERQELAAPKPTAQEHGQHGVIAEFAGRGWWMERQQPPPLLRREPVAQVDAEAAHALHPSNSGRQFGTEQARIGRFVGHAPYRCEPQVDRRRGIASLFEVVAIAEDNRAVERESRL